MGISINQINSLQVLRLKPAPSLPKRVAWSPRDLNQLRTLLQSYLSMKEIARAMDRSPASINSVIDRHNMRLRKYTKRSPTASSSPLPKKPAIYLERESATEGLRNLPTLMDFATLVTWLSMQGLQVTATAYRQAGNLQLPLYYLEGQLMPAYRILMKANQLRAKGGLPLAHVHGITEF